MSEIEQTQERCPSIRHFVACYRKWKDDGDPTVDYLDAWLEKVLELPRIHQHDYKKYENSILELQKSHEEELEKIHSKHKDSIERMIEEHEEPFSMRDHWSRLSLTHAYSNPPEYTCFYLDGAIKKLEERHARDVEAHQSRDSYIIKTISEIKEACALNVKQRQESIDVRKKYKAAFIDWLLQVFKVRMAVSSVPVPEPMVVQCHKKHRAKEFLEHVAGEELKSVWVKSWSNWSYSSTQCFVDILNPNALVKSVATASNSYQRERALCDLHRDCTALERLSKQQEIRGTTPVVVLDNEMWRRDYLVSWPETRSITIREDAQFDKDETALAIGQALAVLKGDVR